MQGRFQEAFGAVENIWERTARAYDEQIDIPETGGGREGSELLHENGSRTDSPELFGAVARREELTGVVKRTIEKVNPPERSASVPAGLRQGTEQEELSGAGKLAEEFKDDLTEIRDVSLADIISTQPSPEEEENQEPVIEKGHDPATDDEAETADPEDGYGDALGKEGLDRYNQEVWEMLEEKKERQKKRAEEKKRTDRWLRRLREAFRITGF